MREEVLMCSSRTFIIFTPHSFLSVCSVHRVREMVVGSSIDKVYMVMDFGGMDLKVRLAVYFFFRVEIRGTIRGIC